MSNGNITRSRSYTYGTNEQVATCTLPAGMVDSNSVDYGPDMQSVTSEMYRTYQKLYEKFYWDDYEEKVVTDHLGSITALYNSSGTKVLAAGYDAWGRRTVTTGTLEFRRGYTGHEHIDGYDLINMNSAIEREHGEFYSPVPSVSRMGEANGRVYDPLIGRFLSPDPFIQMPDFSQSFNRYSYCLNNPLKYTDPDGESIVGAIIFGAIIGTYSGGVLANDGEFNPVDWDWESGKTWGYMAGGMLTGALSGAAGAAIASSGIPMANTLSIMGGSLTNSLCTYAYTGGKTDITMSLGFASYNFTQNSWGWLGKKGNSKLENVGYALGALGNIGDFLMLGHNIDDVDVITDPHGEGHSSIVKEKSIGNNIYDADKNTGKAFDNDKIISVGPDKSDGRSWLWKKGHNKWYTHAADDNIWRETIRLNENHLYKYASFLDNLESSGKLIYSAPLSSCVTHTSIALNLSGILNVGIHPVILHTQLYLRNLGIRPSLYSYYMLK